jgi:hypothetical protein
VTQNLAEITGVTANRTAADVIEAIAMTTLGLHNMRAVGARGLIGMIACCAIGDSAANANQCAICLALDDPTQEADMLPQTLEKLVVFGSSQNAAPR